MSFQQILDKHRSLAFSERDKGSRFERLMQAYLRTDPQFHFQEVWLWNEFPSRTDLGGTDTGIDLVALTHEGDYWAVQCKCVQESTLTDKPAVDSFLATSGRAFRNAQMQTVQFAHRLWISTSNHWGANANESLKAQNPPVSRINLSDLIAAPVDWELLDKGISGEESRRPKKTLRAHQKEVVEKAHQYFQSADRGKLIMACGTGKTYTALRIAEKETGGSGLILFLVPSIALLGQTLREWSADAAEQINAVCICSDPEISRKKSKNEDADSFSVVDLALPASTNAGKVLHQFQTIRVAARPGLTVVFSTYQSIEVIAKVQQELLANGFPAFDLIICDEAHRTTGVTLAGQDESAFTKVHDNDFLKAKRRLYMTATPRLYADEAKSRATQADAVLCSMDDEALYGQEIHHIGFGEAVERGLLADYKVLILTLNDRDVPPAVQRMLAVDGKEIGTDDSAKLIGCINALSKQFIGGIGEADAVPMRRAVAFCQSIPASKQIAAAWNTAADAYLGSLPAEKKEQMVCPSAQHIDGTMSAPQRDEMLTWLKADTPGNECRILSNVRVLSEGVDVPSLDAVLFLSTKNSQIDVVQSVGRVMRKSPGKGYGWIIIPVIVPADVEPDKALDDNEQYKVVWTVLNALRAHDDRFNATVNKIELNRKKPDNILIGRPEYSFDNDGQPLLTTGENEPAYQTASQPRQLALQFAQLQGVIYARMVEKVGDRRYWEQWAKDVAEIAARQIERIKFLIESKPEQRAAFAGFLDSLQRSINPGIGENQAVEMLAQHLVSGPVFAALFAGYSFVRSNAVSAAMQQMLDALHGESLAEESDKMQRFYESVRTRAEKIDNAEGRQRVIIELYDKFFKNAFPKLTEQLGIVYTPVEVVDFIIHSVDDILHQEFGRGITDENVHILDPFTGTGTFITRLLHSGLIEQKDLARKYKQEIHANEIVLLAYYIAAVNIENEYHDLSGEAEYTPFENICLTDTFQLNVNKKEGQLSLAFAPLRKNSERIDRQKQAPLRVIIGNPPYSVGQKSANDNAQNQKYEVLNPRIAETYAKATTANNKNSLYDSYIKAFRWSSDRLDPQHGGVIAFVSNGAWLDGNSADGFRKCLEKEFSSIYVLNLRGNQRTSGELSRKEGGKIFGSGSRTPVAITLLVKNPQANAEKAVIRYHDIGDYLTREEKLKAVKAFHSAGSETMPWTILQPNEQGDWISLRNNLFETFIQMGDKDNKENRATFFLPLYSNGLKTQRDAWCYNSSGSELESNVRRMLNFYNEQAANFQKEKENNPASSVKDFICYDADKISWTRALEWDAEKGKQHSFEDGAMVQSIYRPFFKQHLYSSRALNEMVYQMPKLFPKPGLKNLVICVSGLGGTKENTAIMTGIIPDLNCLDAGTQCFPLYYYEQRKEMQMGLFDVGREAEYIRRDGVSDFIYNRAVQQYGKSVGKEDIFYYIYGFLHSPEYRAVFANDLKKMLPRLPLVDSPQDFWAFSKAGRALAALHVGYEAVPPCPGVEISGAEHDFFRVEKMRFPAKEQKETILFNSRVIVSGIPAKAYQYIVNGKSAIEWVMERYQVTVHKESGIKNDPNDWADEVGKPRYILDLLLSVINLSVQTVEIVEGLPKVMFEEVAG